MRRLQNINPIDWEVLCQRSYFDKKELGQIVNEILNSVQVEKDYALFRYTEEFDKVKLTEFKVESSEIDTAKELVSQELKEAINLAYNNIYEFHSSQLQEEYKIETTPGVTCWRKNVGIEKVGLYVPGGTAPLFSTVLMLGVPARIAGCKELILCTPCNQKGEVNPTILYTAHLLGIDSIFKLGGAQAIAAMAYGTESVPKVNKIFGPGNQYVTKAKELVNQDGTAIDMPAGPSELMIIADDSAIPKYVAADLLSQLEHGVDSQVILLSNNEHLIAHAILELDSQLALLPRANIIKEAIINSKAILFQTIQECMDFSNAYAPEHLILVTKDVNQLAEKVVNAGSVFLGNYSCESAGDYASGTNHTLPTNGFAKSYSGVSVDSFVKKITFQSISAKGLKNIGAAIELMAEKEELVGHKNAVSIRLNDIENV